MGDYGNLFPSWVTFLGCLMAIVGMLALLAGVVMGVVWLINHIQFI